MNQSVANNISLGIAVLLALGALAGVPRLIPQWLEVRRQYGGIPWTLARQMVGYPRKSRMAWPVGMTALLAPLSVVLVARRLLHDDPWQFGVMALAGLAFALAKLADVARPPSVLFLGGSTPLSAQTMLRLVGALPHCRTVALLDPRERLPMEQAGPFYYNNLRTTNIYEWRSIVFHLMDVAPVVVVDPHALTRGVQEELARLERLGYHGRTGAIHAPGAPPPAPGWEGVERDALPEWVRGRLAAAPQDAAGRRARQAAFDAMLQGVPRPLRMPEQPKDWVQKARWLQHGEVLRFLAACKQGDPGVVGSRLFEDIPTRSTRAEELRFLRTSRAFEEAEVLFGSALEAVDQGVNPTHALNVAIATHSLGICARLRCDWPAAERLMTQAIGQLEVVRQDPEDCQAATAELATAHFNLGDVYLAQYRESGAAAQRQQAERHYRTSQQLDAELGRDTLDTAGRLRALDLPSRRN